MRELKFRAWHKKEKRWLPGYDFAINGECEIYLYTQGISEDGFIRSTEDLEIVQYTGLKDKNGKEIYEGDIIKLSNSTDSTVFGKDVGVVKFMEDRASWYLDTGDFNDWTQLRREIIGNIYENPGLLREAK